MQKKISQNKLRGSKLCSFSLATSMNEKLCLEWRKDETMLEITFPNLVFWKRCVGNPNILFEIFTYMFLCSCSCRKWRTHKHNNNLRYVFKLYPFPFKFLFLCMFALNSCKILKLCRFLGFLGVQLRQQNFPWPLLKLLSSKLRNFKKGEGNFFALGPS
jgi:hypothetical protein